MTGEKIPKSEGIKKVCEQCGNCHIKKYSNYCSDKCQVDNTRARAFGRNTLNDTIRNLKQALRESDALCRWAIKTAKPALELYAGGSRGYDYETDTAQQALRELRELSEGR